MVPSPSERPGISRPPTPSSPEQLSTISAKNRFEAAIKAAGFGGAEQGRELARFLHKGESTVRGWRNPKALDRRPPDEACDQLEEYADFLRLRGKFGAM